MNDDFNRQLLELASTSPDIQEALKKSFSTEGWGYSIPTGDICLDVFELSEKAQGRDIIVQAIKKAQSLTVQELSQRLAELRVALNVKMAEGETLAPLEKTLRDIDITALATWALVAWLKAYYKPERSGNDDN